VPYVPNRRVLVVGSGGREHALAWRLARDPSVELVRVAPGNEGMERAFSRLAVSERDPEALGQACREERIDLVVVGPEAPLAAGLVNALAARGVLAFGPTSEAAALESSKWFAKEIMREAGVPTARAEVFDRIDDARAALGRAVPPYVIKVDGLAAGKGVCVTPERGAAESFLRGCLEGDRFGDGGRRVVIEEHLDGDEASVMAVCDGERCVLLPAARDFKRAEDGDRGPNTGGMGAFAPTPAVDAALERVVAERIVAPVLAAMRRRGAPYRGVLYVGLMLTADGPKVVEFNCRFGDPETQVVMPLVEGDVAGLLEGAARGRLDAGAVSRGSGAAVGVALVDEGYPEAVRGTGTIGGLDALERHEDVQVFHAGTRRGSNGAWEVRGGRAATVVARAPDLARARDRAYAAIATLGGSGWRCRHDIARAHSTAAAAHG
jgi:phosphoribosylamine--glycine ligase